MQVFRTLKGAGLKSAYTHHAPLHLQIFRTFKGAGWGSLSDDELKFVKEGGSKFDLGPTF